MMLEVKTAQSIEQHVKLEIKSAVLPESLMHHCPLSHTLLSKEAELSYALMTIPLLFSYLCLV